MQTKKLTGVSADEHHSVGNNTNLILRQSAVVPTGIQVNSDFGWLGVI
jgi:hypothetical protein